jgi:hypothetical protein
MILSAFLFLALAIGAAWLRPLSLRPLSLWLPLFVMALAWGLVGGVLEPVAIAVLTVLTATAYGCAKAQP